MNYLARCLFFRRVKNKDPEPSIIDTTSKFTSAFSVGSAMLPLGKDQDKLVTPDADPLHLKHEMALDTLDWEYFAVFDGHGRTETAAELCEEDLHKLVLDIHQQSKSDDLLPSDHTLRTAFVRIHDLICLTAKEEHNFRTGTTAVTAFVSRPKSDLESKEVDVLLAWTGDSRALLVSGTEIVGATVDHNVATNAKERERLAHNEKEPRPNLLRSPMWQKEVKEAAEKGVTLRANSFVGRRMMQKDENDPDMISPEKLEPIGPEVLFCHSNGISLQVSRSLGDPSAARSAIPDPEVLRFRIDTQTPHKLILASDGLWDVLSNESVTEILKSNKTAQKIASKLVKSAKKIRKLRHLRGDDITVIVVDLTARPEEIAESSSESKSSVDG